MEETKEDLVRRLELAEFRVLCARELMRSLADFCHELGQPATVFLSSVELMQLGCDEETRQSVLGMCQEAADELRTLLAQMKEKRAYVTDMLSDSTPGTADLDALKERRKNAQPRFPWEK